MKTEIHSLKPFLILWSTQSLSQLGSAMTSFALSLWLYGRTGSALQTALLSVCTYAPYVVMSIFAGALSDRWDKKKTMLACDTLAACCTAAVLVLLKAGLLAPVHIYLLNILSGLMNTVQQPASDVAMTLLLPPGLLPEGQRDAVFLQFAHHPVKPGAGDGTLFPDGDGGGHLC